MGGLGCLGDWLVGLGRWLEDGGRDVFEVYKPIWSPDGCKLLVVCFDVQAQIEKLCTMNANGRNLHVVVATPDFVNFPAWGTHPPKR